MITDLKQQVSDNAISAGVPVDIALKLVDIESGWNTTAVSNKGAYGLFQLMPKTAKQLGVNPYVISENIKGGLEYLRQMYDNKGNWYDALVAYNAGPNATTKGINQGKIYADKFGNALNSGNSDITNQDKPLDVNKKTDIPNKDIKNSESSNKTIKSIETNSFVKNIMDFYGIPEITLYDAILFIIVLILLWFSISNLFQQNELSIIK